MRQSILGTSIYTIFTSLRLCPSLSLWLRVFVSQLEVLVAWEFKRVPGTKLVIGNWERYLIVGLTKTKHRKLLTTLENYYPK